MPTAEDRHGLVMPSAGQSSSSSGSPTASPAADGARSAADILRLNVSGVRYDVRRDVLRAVQGSLFMFLFSGRYDRHFLRVPDERTGEELMFLDIDHEAFQIMLEELRRYHGAGVELHCRPLPPPPHSDNPAMTFYFDLCLKPWSWEATRLLPRAHSHPSLDADKAATADTSKPTAALEPPPATTSTHTTPPDVCYSPSSRLSHRDIAEALQPFLHEWVVAKGIADNEPATASTSNGSSGSRQGSVWQGVTRSDEVVSVDVTASSSASGGNERVSVRVSTTLATIEGVGWDNRGLPTLLLNRFCRWHGPIVDVPPSRVRQMIDLCRRRRLQGCMRHSHPHPHHPHTPKPPSPSSSRTKHRVASRGHGGVELPAVSDSELQAFQECLEMYDLLRPDVVRAPPPLQDGSSLVVTLKDAMRLRQWIETDDIQVREFRLLYRASRDGWKYDDCVARINGQARLVFLVRCKEEIVGAFTSERFELPSDPSSYLVQWGCCDMFKLRGSAARPFTGKLTIKGDERRIAIAGTEGRVSLAVDPQKYGKLCFCAGRLWLWRWHDYPLINPCRMLCQRHPYQQCDSDGLMIDPADESRTAYAIFRPGRDTEGVPSSPTMWRQHARTDTWGFPNIARYMMGGAWLGSCKDDTTDQGEPVRAVMPGGGPYFYCSEIEVLTVL